MNRPLLNIDAPKISDEAAASLQDLLFVLTEAFSTHYDHQIERYYFHSNFNESSFDNTASFEGIDDEPPF